MLGEQCMEGGGEDVVSEVMSACDWGMKPARVMECRQMAMVRASGLLVKTEQLLQHRRVSRQYLVMVPVTRPVVRFEAQTMQVVLVESMVAWMVLMGLWRYRAEHGAHQWLPERMVQVWPLMSKEPH